MAQDQGQVVYCGNWLSTHRLNVNTGNLILGQFLTAHCKNLTLNWHPNQFPLYFFLPMAYATRLTSIKIPASPCNFLGFASSPEGLSSKVFIFRRHWCVLLMIILAVVPITIVAERLRVIINEVRACSRTGTVGVTALLHTRPLPFPTPLWLCGEVFISPVGNLSHRSVN